MTLFSDRLPTHRQGCEERYNRGLRYIRWIWEPQSICHHELLFSKWNFLHHLLLQAKVHLLMGLSSDTVYWGHFYQLIITNMMKIWCSAFPWQHCPHSSCLGGGSQDCPGVSWASGVLTHHLSSTGCSSCCIKCSHTESILVGKRLSCLVVIVVKKDGNAAIY